MFGGLLIMARQLQTQLSLILFARRSGIDVSAKFHYNEDVRWAKKQHRHLEEMCNYEE